MLERVGFVVGAAVMFAGCFCGDASTGGQGGGGGGGNSSPTEITYDLVEMTGEFKITGSTISGSCTSVTTDARTLLSIKKPDTKSATFTLKTGELTGDLAGTITQPVRAGTTTCSAGAPTACPKFADQAFESDTFLKLTTEPPALGKDPAPGLAFIPVLENVRLRELCENVPFLTNPVWLRGKPVSVAQLTSGRFVVEASGTTPLEPEEAAFGGYAPKAVTGTMAYSFRLVFQTADYDPKNAVAAPDLPSFDTCLTDVDATEAEQLASKDAFAAGATDIAMNATGCRRLKVTRAAGSESIAYERTFGTRLVFDAATGTTRAEADTRVLYTHTVDPAGIHETFDRDRDGTIDERVETTFDAGVWAATVSTETGSNGASIARTRVDATTMNVRVERGGAVIDEFVAPIVQQGCFDASSMQAPECRPAPGPAPTCTNETPKACSAAVSADLEKQLTAAIKKGSQCLKDAGLKVDPTEKLSTAITARKLNFLCTADPCADLGQLATAPDGDGTLTMMINTTRNTNPAERARTLFHESMHADRNFVHDDTLVKAASNACKLQITDRTYACETMCFNPQAANKCVCMRCLSEGRFFKADADTCKKCQKFGSCAGRSEGGKGVATAIGAYCGRGKVFCDTKAECDTACAPYGGGCQQLKATCDAGCN